MRRFFVFIYCFLGFILQHSGQEHGYLGAALKNSSLDGTKGLLITNLMDDGAAETAGLKENDLITHIADTRVANSDESYKRLSQFGWGDNIEIRLIRNGMEERHHITLGFLADEKTYNIIRSDQLGGKNTWYFDDLTTIVLNGDTPVSITKKDDSGKKETLDLESIIDYTTVPQKFLDLADKLDIISKSKEEQKIRRSDASNIVYIKQVKKIGQPAPAVSQFEFEAFDVFPNPVHDHLNVRLEMQETADNLLSWFIYNTQGQCVQLGSERDFGGFFEQKIGLSEIPAGSYLLYFMHGNRKLTRPFIKQ